MANWVITKTIKNKALKSDGIEVIIPVTSFRMAGNALIVLRGLKILKALSGLSETDGIGVSSKIPKITTMKSIQFQKSLR
jgi:hypothetical protein